jgi:uncharacterized integral membrane protein
MSLGALLAILALLVALGVWVVITNPVMTKFTLAPGLAWDAPAWLLMLGGFAGGAFLILLLQVGSHTRRESPSGETDTAWAALEERLDAVEAQLQSLAAAPASLRAPEEKAP